MYTEKEKNGRDRRAASWPGASHETRKGIIAMKSVTIKDIAKIAGVSYATVSRALSNSPGISEDTRARVLEICREQGYRPNILARSLISNKTNVLGLIVPDISNTFYAEVAFNLETYARQLGYNVMLCNSLSKPEQTASLFEFLVGHQVDGMILVSPRDDEREQVAKQLSLVPTVIIGDSEIADNNTICEASSIRLDNFAGGQLGTEYLLGLGHKDIVYIGFRTGSMTHTRRVSGYKAAMKAAGYKRHVLNNEDHFSSTDAGYRLGLELFRGGTPCTAVFAANDAIALGVMRAADECGVRIPDDVSLLGFDNISYAGLPKIMLTTIDQRKPRLAAGAIDLLIDAIDHPDREEDVRRIIRPALIERNTCKRLVK